MKTRISVVGLALAAALASPAIAAKGRAADRPAKAPPEVAAGACDYACLTSLVDKYLNAMVAHDPRQIPAAPHVRLTENTIPLKLGDALWGTLTAVGSYKLYFADPAGGTAGIEASIRENGTPAIVLLRLKQVGGKISEVEVMVHRNAAEAEALEKFGRPNAAWTQPLEASQRVSRDKMWKIANSYFDGILHSDSSAVPFDPQCDRILDGDQDTNNPTAKGWFDKDSFKPDAMGIAANMNTRIWSYIHSIAPRRMLVLDEKMGIAVGMFMFNHPGNVLFADVPNVGRVPMPAVVKRPSSVLMGEFFKIESGRIRRIEGVSISLPYGAKTGWETAEK